MRASHQSPQFHSCHNGAQVSPVTIWPFHPNIATVAELGVPALNDRNRLCGYLFRFLRRTHRAHGNAGPWLRFDADAGIESRAENLYFLVVVELHGSNSTITEASAFPCICHRISQIFVPRFLNASRAKCDSLSVPLCCQMV